ncbi:MAG: hypothetical protein D6698_12740 [Gammaproteobacteria bacterium]|nr:MAG: hypothetical protein D6698_12740 [Gammaproteobacteria bacterium]
MGRVLCNGIVLSQPADASTAYTENAGSPNASIVYNYTFRACGNGPADYTVASSISAVTNASAPPAANAPTTTPNPAAAILNVGASVTLSGSTATVINLPSDGTADAVVNGLAVGDSVVIGTSVRQITAVSDPGGNGVATLTLNTALATAPAAGVNIVEQVPFTLTVTSGKIITLGTDITVTVNTTVSSSDGVTTFTSPADVTISTFTSNAGTTLVKLVRNVTNAAGNNAGAGAVTHQVNGVNQTYYSSGVVGNSGDTLEYILVMNNAGTTDVTDTRVTDSLPVSFVTAPTNIRVIVVNAAGTLVSDTTRTVVADADTATYTAPTLTVNVGDAGPANPPPGAGGTLTAGATVKVVYQVNIQ